MMPSALRSVRVLVVDDSPLIRGLLEEVLDRPGFEVVGTAQSGTQAIQETERLRPDVITMDLKMPGSDGFAGIAGIMASRPTPILVLTGSRTEEAAFRALSLGALDLLEKSNDIVAFGEQLRSRLRLLASVPVIRHPRGKRDTKVGVLPERRRVELVAIAASLGGPRALSSVLASLPRPFSVPVVVVQHMAVGFTEGLTRWLRTETGLPIREAEDLDELVAGEILFAPAGSHLLVEREQVRLYDGPPVHGFRPSATPLFRSVAASYGSRACGVVLTGMGDDGSDGLRELRDAGAVTLAQDEATCAVFGMPRAAIAAGAVEQVLPLQRIAEAIAEVVR